jgi:putative ABC transport system substrate-binding protein
MLLSLILALSTLLPFTADAYDILVLQTRHDKGYEEVLKGFRSGHGFSQRLLVLSDYSEVDVPRIVREERPRLILAIGDKALEATRAIRNTPVIALMTLAVHDLHARQPNLTGIGMFAPPESYCALFKAIGKRRVGVIYNQAKSGWYLPLARRAAQEQGIELVLREVSNPRDTPAKLDSLAGKIDALWMLPDSTAVTRTSSQAYFRFAQTQSIPLVSFAGAYLELGAALAIDLDQQAMGSQASDMAAELLENYRRGKAALETPQKTRIRANRGVLQRLKIDIHQLEKFAITSRY